MVTDKEQQVLAGPPVEKQKDTRWWWSAACNCGVIVASRAESDVKQQMDRHLEVEAGLAVKHFFGPMRIDDVTIDPGLPRGHCCTICQEAIGYPENFAKGLTIIHNRCNAALHDGLGDIERHLHYLQNELEKPESTRVSIAIQAKIIARAVDNIRHGVIEW